jgi:hypothetical protein
MRMRNATATSFLNKCMKNSNMKIISPQAGNAAAKSQAAQDAHNLHIAVRDTYDLNAQSKCKIIDELFNEPAAELAMSKGKDFPGSIAFWDEYAWRCFTQSDEPVLESHEELLSFVKSIHAGTSYHDICKRLQGSRWPFLNDGRLKASLMFAASLLTERSRTICISFVRGY